MELLTDLRADHRLLDDLAGALYCWSIRCAEGEAGTADGRRFARTLRALFDGHHAREEGLFRALVDRAEVPGDRGPIMVLRGEHSRMQRLVTALEAGADDRVSECVQDAHLLSRLLREHIDKEDSVLLLEAESRLVRNGVRRLQVPPRTDDEEAAVVEARALITSYPPLEDDDVVRGDGCVACAAFTETCHGIEAEWWTTWERAHYRSLDEG